jgi:hypothetical protein
LLALLVVSISICPASKGQTVRLKDRSDWWSMYNEQYPGITTKLIEKRFSTDNFKILGLSLDTDGFDKIAAKLGKARIVERGDASYSRSQACYVSTGDSDKIHLIFEGGEGNSSSFYLFRDGADWRGSNLCIKSDDVSEDLVTGTGLRIGLSRAEVETILGKPDFVKGDRIAYCREFKRKATKVEFETSRREYPMRLSDKMAHEEFDFLSVSIQMEARFKNLEMNYLYVSTDLLTID